MDEYHNTPATAMRIGLVLMAAFVIAFVAVFANYYWG